jgi:4-oxalocrotonate tautomerase
MPYVNVKITREGATADQKAQLIHDITDSLVRVLGKEPSTTFVVIEEVELDSWGIAGVPVESYRRQVARRGAFDAAACSNGRNQTA